MQRPPEPLERASKQPSWSPVTMTGYPPSTSPSGRCSAPVSASAKESACKSSTPYVCNPPCMG
eukprot:4089643-Prymnesium_polylepis.1